MRSQVKRVVAEMARLPTRRDPIDAATRVVLRATPADAAPMVADQAVEADRAQRSGARGDRVTVAVLLAALAMSLAALAAVARARRPSLLDLAAAAVLGTAVAALASVPLL